MKVTKFGLGGLFQYDIIGTLPLFTSRKNRNVLYIGLENSLSFSLVDFAWVLFFLKWFKLGVAACALHEKRWWQFEGLRQVKKKESQNERRKIKTKIRPVSHTTAEGRANIQFQCVRRGDESEAVTTVYNREFSRKTRSCWCWTFGSFSPISYTLECVQRK